MKSERIQHELVQGTPEWHAFRLNHDGASEARAALGLPGPVSRSELLRIKHTGVAKEFSDFVQEHILDRGHEVEALARPMAEAILGEELYPATYSYGRLSASSDGLTMSGDTSWECKQWAAELAASVARGELPDEHQPQCQQTMLVNGSARVLFMVTDGTPEKCVHMFVKPHGKWMERVKAGWAMFNQDLANYQPAEVLPAAVAAPTMQLPALSIQVTGSIALVDNLKVFGERLESFISGIDKNPSDDQAFADAEAAIKTLGTAETALEAAKSSALAQTASIDEMTRTVALYAAQARTCRLMLTRLVKDRKESIRVEIVQGGKAAFTAHITSLNKRIGKPYMFGAAVEMPDFSGAIKGKKTISSLHDAVDTMLARSKIAANELADKIEINLNFLREHAKEYAFLFADAGNMVLKDTDVVENIVKIRIMEHKAAEAKRIEVEAEKARERIRAEEAAKAKAEQERIARAEREAQEKLALAARQREEAAAREQRERVAVLAKEQAAAQELQPAIVVAENVRTASTPAPLAAPISSAAPFSHIAATPSAIGAVAGTQCPRLDEIVSAVAYVFSVADETAYAWIIEAIAADRKDA